MALSAAVLDEIARSLIDHGYSLGEYIGSGSFGAVYTVKATHYDQVFCVKVVMRCSSRPYTEESFIAEFDSLLRLSHPTIVRLYNVWSTDSCHFLILEYISHGSIDKLISEQRGLSVALIRAIGAQILAGLAYCHTKNFCHGDIKPANILIDEFGHARLADFGLSGTIAKLRSDLTHVRGSVGFLPPERLLGTATDPRATDVWALGVTFFMMATGTLPWTQASLDAAIDQIRSGKVDFPPTMDRELQDAIARMLTIDEKRRPTMQDTLAMPFFQGHEPFPSMPSIVIHKEIPTSQTFVRPRQPLALPRAAKRLAYPLHSHVASFRRGWGSLGSRPTPRLIGGGESWLASER